MGAHEPPDEPIEWAAERPADALLDVRQDFLFRTRFAGERDRERRDLGRVHASADLETIPRAALEILCRDRVRVEVTGRNEMERAAHESRADHLVAFDGRPELLAPEAFQPRPERDVWRRRPLCLEGREALDRPNDADPARSRSS